MNTAIEYLYRDSGNYKVWNKAVISGVLTQEQIDTIITCLEDRLWFVPHLVGLPEQQFDTWDPEADHSFFELEKEWIKETDRTPTIDLTPENLVAAFMSCKGKWWLSIY